MSDTGAFTLKRLMNALGLTGKELASSLSSYRYDGKSTSQGTVSRWLNGTYAVEPSVIAWLTELLRKKVIVDRSPVVDWGGRGSLVITVSSLSGGVGVTTLAMNLAAAAHEHFGMKSRYVSVGLSSEPPVSGGAQAEGNFISSSHIDVDEFSELDVKFQEVVFVDLGRDVSLSLYEDREFASRFFEFCHLDYIVLPGRYDNPEHVESGRRFLAMPELDVVTRLVQMSKTTLLDFENFGGEIEKGIFFPAVVMHDDSYALKAVEPGFYTESFSGRSYVTFLESLLGSLGVYPSNGYDRELLVSKMSTEELLDLHEGRSPFP